MSTAVIEEAAPRQGRRAFAPALSLEPATREGSEMTASTDPGFEPAEQDTSLEVTSSAVESTKGQPYYAEAVEDLVRGQLEAGTARSIAAAAAYDRSLSPKAAELLNSLLVLSATDLSRGNPWDSHNMSQRDWFEAFLFEDVAGWLSGIGDPYTFRAFRTAMYSNDALAAFNAMPALVRSPGVREEAAAAVRHFAGSLKSTQELFAAAGV